ncbi:MAG: hypothetical protein PHO91_01620 [Patescibacteria group bacterium]|nr:hypothetical protein [Patescibacteria group bacterium]
MNTIWIILGVIAIILLLMYWKSKNAVWGGLTLGIIIGAIISLALKFQGNNFNWLILLKGAIVGILSGFIAELLSKLGKTKIKQQ